ncbi:MAG: glycosyltransferase family 4 protein [Planctomycetaceae bacterium]|nr:glycosyltransferase family 4 protein [Planctomycetaceae bacterium]
MRIGFFGNTNNFPIMLALAFRRLGHDVRCVIHRPEPLHRPEFRYADILHPYPPWIREIVMIDAADFVTNNPRRREVVRWLRACDFVVLNELGVSLAGKIARPYLAMLTGSDLSYYCNPASGCRVINAMTTRNPLKRLWGRWVWQRLLHEQRNSVCRANLVFHFARGLIPANDALLDDIGVDDSRRMFFLMADVGNLPYTPPTNRSIPRTFCATRLTWKKPELPGDSPLDFKGSDVMIRGLGLFWRESKCPLDINLVRKGRHVQETVDLVEQEGLTPLVTWHDEMTQAEIWRQYACADVLFEQFGEGIVAMAGLEGMAAGRPLIANGRPEILEPMLGEPSPICQATTPREVYDQLQRLLSDDALRRHVGEESRTWVQRHFAPELAAQKIVERLAL